MNAFDGHVALVTGGGQGLGATIARELGAGGAAVVVSDMNLATATAVATTVAAAASAASATVAASVTAIATSVAATPLPPPPYG
jgi:NAD(P)-dependent dehydrogenase (short-subunit alcohol dehydrogenase family)